MDHVNTKRWTEQEVWELLQRSPAAVIRALVVLYGKQTSDEKELDMVKHLNSQGFNKVDAPFGSSLARQVLEGENLTLKQVNAARGMLRKYCGQLSRIAQGSNHSS